MCRIYQEHASQVDVQIYQEHASQVDIRYIYYEQVIEGFVICAEFTEQGTGL